MHFLKRIKPIKLSFYTGYSGAFEYFKPVYARDYKPSWLKEATVDKNDTHIKHCYGLRQSYSTGFILPLWTEIFLSTRINEHGYVESRNIEANDKLTPIEPFQPGAENIYSTERDLFKVVSPWHVVCDEDIDFVAMENMFNRAIPGVEFMSGVLQFKYQHATNMFFYLSNMNKDIILKTGDAPFIYKQLSERPLEIKSYYDPETAYYYETLRSHEPWKTHIMHKGMQAIKRNKRIGK